MRRADRLFRILQLLRGRRRAITARQLAERLEVSERTIYRDVRDLAASGTPIEGEAGIGYRLRDFDLPPLMFDADEAAALVLGARVVAAFGDAALARAARSAASKVEAVLPQKVQAGLDRVALYAPRATGVDPRTSEALFVVRSALASRQKLQVRYQRPDGQRTERVIRPLGAFFWGKTWTVAAWCELRDGFRNFRLDRMEAVVPMNAVFHDETGRTLRDYLASIGPRAEALLDG